MKKAPNQVIHRKFMLVSCCETSFITLWRQHIWHLVSWVGFTSTECGSNGIILFMFVLVRRSAIKKKKSSFFPWSLRYLNARTTKVYIFQCLNTARRREVLTVIMRFGCEVSSCVPLRGVVFFVKKEYMSLVA